MRAVAALAVVVSLVPLPFAPTATGALRDTERAEVTFDIEDGITAEDEVYIREGIRLA